MKDYIEEIKDFPLFTGIKEEKLDAMLTCLGSYVRHFYKGEFLFLEEESVNCIGVVLDGTIHMTKEDLWGNKTILVSMKRGEIFGETFACGNVFSSAVAFYSAADSRVLFLPFHKVLHTCNMTCVFHHRLIENMVSLIAGKNIQLMEKIEVTSKKTLREKIMAYLSLQALHQQKDRFEIPLGRLELAEYLCADRSALTRELNHMRTEGLLEYEKNSYYLKKK